MKFVDVSRHQHKTLQMFSETFKRIHAFYMESQPHVTGAPGRKVGRTSESRCLPAACAPWTNNYKQYKADLCNWIMCAHTNVRDNQT
jgi:hypothetical protein